MSVPTEMGLVVRTGGDATCIYDEGLDLRKLGKLQITRASHVEPDAEGYWWADLGPVAGPVAGALRQQVSGVGGGEAVVAWRSAGVSAGV